MTLGRKLRPKHVRTRLTVWYMLVLATVLLLSWGLTASFLFLKLRNQLDHYAIQDIETVEGLLFFDTNGQLMLHEDYHNHPESKQVLERFMEVRSPEGNLLYRNDRLGTKSLGGDPFTGEGEGGYSPRSARLSDGTSVRVVSRRHILDGHPLVIRIAYSLQPLWAGSYELFIAWLLAVPVILAIAGIGGYFLARRTLAPLEEMAVRAEQITSDRLHERLPTGGVEDELGHLARVFNNLLERLEESFKSLRRFTSDASHELRTPLTSIRNVGEVALQHDVSREEYRDTIGSMLEEVNRLGALVESLLTISRADAGVIRLHPTVFTAMDLAREAVGLVEMLAEEKGQQLDVRGDESLRLNADRLLIRQALVNIVHNAVKYSPAGAAISVRVYHEPARGVCIDVIDSGPGIAPEHVTKIFDRFYRVDESRSRENGGVGLGLSIARWAVRLHHGDLQLLNKQEIGCTFRIALPANGSG
jgi:heavy metal sensor kinase